MRYAAAVLLVVALAAGCGGGPEETLDPPPRQQPDTLSGDELAGKVAEQLRAENPELVPGTLTCDEIELADLGSAQCVRTAVLPGGRRVVISGTVRVTDPAEGTFTVTMNRSPDEFGLEGEVIAGDLTRAYRRQRGQQAQVECPYLAGVVGTRIECTVSISGKRSTVAVRTTATDPATYGTRYGYRLSQ